MSFLYVEDNKVAAAPPFVKLVDATAMNEMFDALSLFSVEQYSNAECVTRDVRRIPIKPEGETDEEPPREKFNPS